MFVYRYLWWKWGNDPANRPENLKVEPEGEVDVETRQVWHLAWRSGKSYHGDEWQEGAGDDDIAVNVLILLGEGGLRSMAQLISNTHTRNWTVTQVTTTALKTKPKATKCSDHRTGSKYSSEDTWRTGKKIKDVLGEDQFRLTNGRGKGTEDVTGLLRIISERTLDIVEELCACLIDWQKPFDRVHRTKLMQILQITDIDWRERRLISKLYMDQSVKVRVGQGVTRCVKTGRGVRQGCSLSPIQFNLYNGSALTKEGLDRFGDFKIGRKFAWWNTQLTFATG